MADSYRLNLTLDDEHADKLRRHAAAAHLKEGTMARSLLSTVLDQLDESESPHPTIVAVLDGIPGALARAKLGRDQGRSGHTVPLADL